MQLAGMVRFPRAGWLFYNPRMLFSLHRRRITLWIAVLAILFSAIAPSISHALALGERGSSWLEVCTASGTRLVADADAPPAPLKDSFQHALDHCPYCATHGGNVGMPPSAMSVLAVIDGHDHYPSLYYHAPAPLFIWAAAQARAPPAA